MVKLTMLAHKQVPTPFLTAMGVADMRLASVVHVPSDVAENVAIDVITDVQGMHTSPKTFMAAVVEDTLQEEGKKSTDSQAIGDHVEPEPEKVPVQAMKDVDEGHPKISGNADVHEENVSLEQVTSSKTHEYISFMKPFPLRKKTLSSYCRRHVVLRDMCVVDMTFFWTYVLTDCNVSQIVRTQPKPQSFNVACYGMMMCMYLRNCRSIVVAYSLN